MSRAPYRNDQFDPIGNGRARLTDVYDGVRSGASPSSYYARNTASHARIAAMQSGLHARIMDRDQQGYPYTEEDAAELEWTRQASLRHPPPADPASLYRVWTPQGNIVDWTREDVLRYADGNTLAEKEEWLARFDRLWAPNGRILRWGDDRRLYLARAPEYVLNHRRRNNTFGGVDGHNDDAHAALGGMSGAAAYTHGPDELSLADFHSMGLSPAVLRNDDHALDYMRGLYP
jgi:hypothetical protein